MNFSHIYTGSILSSIPHVFFQFFRSVINIGTMASPIYKVFVAVGLLCILHAAYSAAQHRTYLRLTKTEFLALPLDIAIQVRTTFLA